MTDFNPNWFDAEPMFNFREKFCPHTDEYLNLRQSILNILLSRGARIVSLPHVRNVYTSFQNAFVGDNQVFVTYRHGPSIKAGYICDLPQEYWNQRIEPVFINDS